MKFVFGCVGFAIVVFLILLYPSIKNTLGPWEDDTKQLYTVERLSEKDARINYLDLIVFNTQPKTFAIAGKSDSLGRRQLLTPMDSVLHSKDNYTWAFETISSYDWTDKINPLFKHRGGYIHFHNIDTLYESGMIQAVYRKKATNQYYHTSFALGFSVVVFALFLINFFVLSVSINWNLLKRILLILFICGVVFSSYSYMFSNAGLGRTWLVFHLIHWLIYGLLIMALMRFRPNFKSDFTYQGIMFLLLVFAFPFTHFLSYHISLHLDESFYNSVLHRSMSHFLKSATESMMLGLGMGAAGLAVFMTGHYNRIKEDREKALYEQHTAIQRLNSLNARLNPHFLYNSLNSIAGLIRQDVDKAEGMTLAVSRFLKHFSNRKEEHIISMREELEIIEDYISIEKIRFGDRLIFEMEVDNDVYNHHIPRGLLQPLIENAVKYGYSTMHDHVYVKLKLSLQSGEMIIQVFDSGKNFDMTLDKGYGISSVYNKLDLLYPNNYSIDFINSPNKYVEVILNPNAPRSYN